MRWLTRLGRSELCPIHLVATHLQLRTTPGRRTSFTWSSTLRALISFFLFFCSSTPFSRRRSVVFIIRIAQRRTTYLITQDSRYGPRASSIFLPVDGVRAGELINSRHLKEGTTRGPEGCYGAGRGRWAGHRISRSREQAKLVVDKQHGLQDVL